MTRLTLLTKPDCCLCDEAAEAIERVRRTVPLELEKVDISSDSQLDAEYGELIPVLLIDGAEAFRYRVDEQELELRLRSSASDQIADEALRPARA